MHTFLGFDIGGSKIAWGILNEEGAILKEGRFPTPDNYSNLLASLVTVAKEQKPATVGLGIPAVFDRKGVEILYSTNLPFLAHHKLAEDLCRETGIMACMNNDAQCALIGEVWQGSAQDFSSAVLLTLGTGVGGALMQKRIVRPYPQDASLELCRLIVDPSDVFPSRTGRGTLEALIGGHSLEKRFGVSLAEMSQKAHAGNADALEFWQEVAELFQQCVLAIHTEYSCKNIIIGGIGSTDLELYMQAPTPCPVIAAALGEKAGIYGAARIAMDYYEDFHKDWE